MLEQTDTAKVNRKSVNLEVKDLSACRLILKYLLRHRGCDGKSIATVLHLLQLCNIYQERPFEVMLKLDKIPKAVAWFQGMH